LYRLGTTKAIDHPDMQGFAIAQSEEFQKYKAERAAVPSPVRKTMPAVSNPSTRPEKGATA
jgi:hypothetical protein